MTSAFVTTHLVVGAVPTNISGPIIQVTTAKEAITVIEHGGTAVLPEGSQDIAREVLKSFGADDEHADFQIAVAHGTHDE